VSWDFSVTTPSGFTRTASVRNAEFNDVDRTEFRQGRGTTDAGLVYVQDLDDDDQFVEAAWGFLDISERAALEDFFGRDGTLRQARSFSIDIVGSSFPQKWRRRGRSSKRVPRSSRIPRPCGMCSLTSPCSTLLRRGTNGSPLTYGLGSTDPWDRRFSQRASSFAYE